MKYRRIIKNIFGSVLAKIQIVTIGIILFTILSLLYLSIIHQKRLVINQIKEDSITLARAIANGCETFIKIEGEKEAVIRETFIEMMQGIINRADIQNITIVDKKFKILFDRDKKIINHNLKTDDIELVLKENRYFQALIDEKKEIAYYKVIMPFYDGFGISKENLKGIVIIKTTLKNLSIVVADIKRLAFIVAIIAIIFSSLVIIFLVKAIFNPVSEFVKFTQKIAKGELSHKIDIKADRELQQLVESFNVMIEGLKKVRIEDKASNPLTGLPGNVSLEKYVRRLIMDNSLFAFIYLDLDNFKAYNDKYGFQKGDKVILLLADILKRTILDYGNIGDFIGHIGGDDFVIITSIKKYDIICRKIIESFDRQIVYKYSKRDRMRGYIISFDRQERSTRFPIMTVSLAVITNKYRKINHYGEITAIAAELKRKVKEKEGSNYMVDRRAF